MWKIVLSVLIPLGASAEEPQFQFDRLKFVTAIQQLKALQDFPSLQVPITTSYSSAKLEIPKSVQIRFADLNNSLFGNPNTFILKACENCPEASTQLNNRVVWLNPNSIETISKDGRCAHPEDTLDFVLAHELSHYIYELWVVRTGKSIFGQASTYADQDPIKRAWRHAEVDSYAFAFMKALKKDLNCAKNFIENLSTTSSSSELINKDAEIRKRSALELLTR